jgi:hypothetical protein
MKQIIIFLGVVFLFFYSSDSIGQKVYYPQSDSLCINTDNSVVISVPGYSCDELIAETNNGTIKYDDSCKYIIRPVNDTITQLTIKSKSNQAIVGTKYFKPLQTPDPARIVFSIGYRKGDVEFVIMPNDTSNVLKVLSFMPICNNNCKCNCLFIVMTYSAEFYSNNLLIKTFNNKGNVLSGEALELFNTFKKGDYIVFKNIQVTTVDNKIRTLKPATYTVE